MKTSIRKAKKLLKLYPPVVEIFMTPDEYHNFLFESNDLKIFMNKWGKLTKEKYFFIFRQIEKREPIICNVDFTEEKLEEFKKQWKNASSGYLTASKEEMNTLEVVEIERIKIHSIINCDFSFYKKKINEYLKLEKNNVQVK